MRMTEEHTALWLALACLLLTPFARAAEIPILLLALLGLRKFILERPWAFKPPVIVNFSLLFLVFWVPMLLSSFDAVNMMKTSKDAWGFIRFYFFGYYLLQTLNHEAALERLLKFANFILLFWVFDALVQFVCGFDLFGFPLVPERLNGVFGDNLKLGLFLGAYSPLVIVSALQAGRTIKLLTSFSLILVVLLAGSRAGWIMFAVGMLALCVYSGRHWQGIPWRNFIVGAFLLVVACGLSYQFIPNFSSRVDQSLLVFNGDTASIDRAISFRLPIWKTGVRMFAGNWLNGVGVRGFRYAYNRYAEDDDIWKNYSKDGTGAMHGHGMLVDIAAETGVVGLVSLLGFCALLVRLWLRGAVAARRRSLPYAAALVAILFPLNTHFAFYSGTWLQVIFWLTVFYLASLHLGSHASRVLPQQRPR